MSKKSRNFKTGGIYHITHRGHNHQYILADDIDKAILLDKLKKILIEHSGQLLYFVLMNNHYHILLEMQETPVDLIMHRLNTGYGRYYSLKYKTTGAVFENRYHAQEVDGLKYLHAVIQYLAMNPIRAGLNEKVTDYRWSAHLDIAQKRPVYVSSQRLFEILGGAPEKGRLIYQDLIQRAQKDPTKKLDPREYQFKRKINILENQLGSYIESLSECLSDPATVEQIQSGKRTPSIVKVRQEFSRQARAQGYTVSEIAATLRVSPRSVRYWCNETDEANQGNAETGPNSH
jgi:REP element-mobilizing transposase RayT